MNHTRRRRIGAALLTLIALTSITTPAWAADQLNDPYDPPPWKNGCTGTWSMSTAMAHDYEAASEEAFEQLGAATGIHFTRLPDNDSGHGGSNIYLDEDDSIYTQRGALGTARVANGTILIAKPEHMTDYQPDQLGQRLNYQMQRNVIEHEILHVLGSPHTLETDSIMQEGANSQDHFGPFELGQMANIAHINGCTPWQAEPSMAMKDADEWNQHSKDATSAAQPQSGNTTTNPLAHKPIALKTELRLLTRCVTAGGTYNNIDHTCTLAHHKR